MLSCNASTQCYCSDMNCMHRHQKQRLWQIATRKYTPGPILGAFGTAVPADPDAARNFPLRGDVADALRRANSLTSTCERQILLRPHTTKLYSRCTKSEENNACYPKACICTSSTHSSVFPLDMLTSRILAGTISNRVLGISRSRNERSYRRLTFNSAMQAQNHNCRSRNRRPFGSYCFSKRWT